MCETALSAAELAIANMNLLNRRRAREKKPALDYGLALHIGDVMYGNVGSTNRLDFTVIGPAVNLTARLETLAGSLGRSLVTSSDFAGHCPIPLKSIGLHTLKGVERQQEVFVPAEE